MCLVNVADVFNVLQLKREPEIWGKYAWYLAYPVKVPV